MSGQVARQKTSSVLNRVLGLIDRVAPPQTRQQLSKNASAFATEQPLLASFLATQLLLSALPLLLFVSFTLATLAVSILAAAAFSIFWIGTALLVLVPTLFLTFSAGVFIWLWAVGTYVFCRFAYNMGGYMRTETRAPRQAAMRTIQGQGERVSGQVGAVREQVRSAVNGVRAEGKRALKQEEGEGEAEGLAPGVPDVVKKSFGRAHQAPEAAANEEAVEEKEQVEDELLSKVPKEDSQGRQGLNGATNATQKVNAEWYANGEGMDGTQQLKSPYVPEMATA